MASAAASPVTGSKPALWVRATRPAYLPTSVIPGLAGSLVALDAADADWGLLPVSLIALLLVHAATNVCNDVEDAARGVDPVDKLSNSRVFTSGALSMTEGRRLYAALFATATLLGVVICLVQGPALLVIGLLGVLGGWLYTGGPHPYKYAGLGDVLIVWLMGPLLTQGAYTALTGDAFHAPAFWLGLVPGLLITAVLAANNTSDVDTDAGAGVRTLAVRIGFVRARALYLTLLAAGLVVLPVLWLAGLFGPWILLPLLATPLAAQTAAATLRAERGSPELELVVARTAQVHLAVNALLCLAVALDLA